MSSRLLILGLLKEGPIHGYEIKQTLEERLEGWLPVAVGSIYFLLGKMAQEGLIEKTAVEQQGNRPSRSVYKITADGESAYRSLLRQSWREVEIPAQRFDYSFYLGSDLRRAEAEYFLSARLLQLDNMLDDCEAHCQRLGKQEGRDAGLELVIREHSLVHLEAELEWTRKLLESVRAGDFEFAE